MEVMGKGEGRRREMEVMREDEGRWTEMEEMGVDEERWIEMDGGGHMDGDERRSRDGGERVKKEGREIVRAYILSSLGCSTYNCVMMEYTPMPQRRVLE